MANLHNISVRLSDGQKRNLARAYRNNEEVTLRLSRNALTGPVTLRVPAQVVKRLQRSRNTGKEMQIKISKASIRKQDGSGIFSSLLPVLKPVLKPVTLGLSALAGAASEGASQIIKKKSLEDKSFKFLIKISTCWLSWIIS